MDTSDEDIWDYKPTTRKSVNDAVNGGRSASTAGTEDLRPTTNYDVNRRRGPRHRSIASNKTKCKSDTICRSRIEFTADCKNEKRLSYSCNTSGQEGVDICLTWTSPCFDDKSNRAARPRPRLKILNENTQRGSGHDWRHTHTQNNWTDMPRPRPNRETGDKTRNTIDINSSRPSQEAGKEKINYGFCPNCQLPFNLLKVQTPRWHVEECLLSCAKSDKECPDGRDCDSTIMLHYKNFTHHVLAKVRAGGDCIDCYVKTEETIPNVEKIEALFGPHKKADNKIKENFSLNVTQKDTKGISNHNKVQSSASQMTPRKQRKPSSQGTHKKMSSSQSTPRKAVGSSKARALKNVDIPLSKQPSILSYFKPNQPSNNGMPKIKDRRGGCEKLVGVHKLEAENSNELDMLPCSSSSSSICEKNADIKEEVQTHFGKNFSWKSSRGRNLPVEDNSNASVSVDNDANEDEGISWSPGIVSDCNTELYNSSGILVDNENVISRNTKASPEDDDEDSEEDMFSPLPKKTRSSSFKAKSLNNRYDGKEVHNDLASPQSEDFSGSEQDIFSPVRRRMNSSFCKNRDEFGNNGFDDEVAGDDMVSIEMEDCSGSDGDISDDAERMINSDAELPGGMALDQCEDFSDSEEDLSLVPKRTTCSPFSKNLQPRKNGHFEEVTSAKEDLNNNEEDMVAVVPQQDSVDSNVEGNAEEENEVEPEELPHSDVKTCRKNAICDGDISDAELVICKDYTENGTHSESSRVEYFDCQETGSNSPLLYDDLPSFDINGDDYSTDHGASSSLTNSSGDSSQGSPHIGSSGVISKLASQFVPFKNYFFKNTNVKSAQMNVRPPPEFGGSTHSQLSNGVGKSSGAASKNFGHPASNTNHGNNYYQWKPKYRNGSTWNSNRQCPFYKKMPDTSIAVDAFCYGTVAGIKAYFLSHFHADHYRGLTKHFQQPIYCSKTTGNLVKSKIRVTEKFIHTLPMYTPCLVEGVQVTLLPANHCPGAVLFLFRLKSGKVYLHTGDFRADPKMDDYPALINCRVHMLYLDTTYCSPEYTFPTQQDAVEYTATLAKKHVEANERTLIICGTYTIGKEKIFLAIAKALGCKVCITREKEKTLKCLEDKSLEAYLTTNKHLTRLHVLPMSDINHKELKEYMNQFPHQYNQVVGIKPTGWTHSKKSAELLDIKPSVSGPSYIYGIPYSEHSSYSELEHFVKFVKPDKIQPTVNVATEASRKKMSNIFDSWMKDEATMATNKRKCTTTKIDSFLTNGNKIKKEFL